MPPGGHPACVGVALLSGILILSAVLSVVAVLRVGTFLIVVTLLRIVVDTFLAVAALLIVTISFVLVIVMLFAGTLRMLARLRGFGWVLLVCALGVGVLLVCTLHALCGAITDEVDLTRRGVRRRLLRRPATL